MHTLLNLSFRLAIFRISQPVAKSINLWNLWNICGIVRNSAKSLKSDKNWEIANLGQNQENDKLSQICNLSSNCSWRRPNIGDLLDCIGLPRFTKAVDYRAPWAHIIKLAPAKWQIPRARTHSSPQMNRNKHLVFRTKCLFLVTGRLLSKVATNGSSSDPLVARKWSRTDLGNP